MSTVKAKQLQLGDNATATQNFVWQTNNDGTAKLARGNVGATTQDILTVDAAGKVTFPQGIFPIRTWVNEFANRVTTTDYTNNTDYDLEVSVVLAGAAAASSLSATVDGLTVGDVTGLSTGTGRLSINFTVPSGSIYKVVRSGAGFSQWNELKVV